MTMEGNGTVDQFVKQQTELIELEKQEEVEKIERLLDSLPRAVIN
jgi:IS30 family transposase